MFFFCFSSQRNSELLQAFLALHPTEWIENNIRNVSIISRTVRGQPGTKASQTAAPYGSAIFAGPTISAHTLEIKGLFRFAAYGHLSLVQVTASRHRPGSAKANFPKPFSDLCSI